MAYMPGSTGPVERGWGKNHVHPIGELEDNVMDVTVGIIYNYPISGKQVGLFQT